MVYSKNTSKLFETKSPTSKELPFHICIHLRYLNNFIGIGKFRKNEQDYAMINDGFDSSFEYDLLILAIF